MIQWRTIQWHGWSSAPARLRVRSCVYEIAKAALAAENQDKFIPFHKALLNSKDPLNKESVLAIAEEEDLDIELLKKDLESLSSEYNFF